MMIRPYQKCGLRTFLNMDIVVEKRMKAEG